MLASRSGASQMPQIRRTIVSHRLKVQSHQVRQQESVPRGIPRPISHVERIGGIRASSRRSESVGGGHGDGSAPPMGSSRGMLQQDQVYIEKQECGQQWFTKCWNVGPR